MDAPERLQAGLELLNDLCHGEGAVRAVEPANREASDPVATSVC